MTKSKKLISMLLAFVMLVTSCSLSLFAYAADSPEAIAEAEAAAEAAFGDGTAINKNTSTLADTYLAKVNALEDVTNLNPVYYAFAFQIATIKAYKKVKGGSGSVVVSNRAKTVKFLTSNDAQYVNAYAENITVPNKYLQVLKDYNDAISATSDDTVSGIAGQSIIRTDIENINFANFADGAGLNAAMATFINKVKNYDAQQLLFADALSFNSNGVYFNIGTDAANASTYDDSLNFYFGSQQGGRIAALYFLYDIKPVRYTAYINVGSSAWNDAANGPANFFDALKSYVENNNTTTKAFYVDYLTQLNGAYPGAATAIGEIIDAGLKLLKGEAVAFADVRAAYEDYSALSKEAKALVKCIAASVYKSSSDDSAVDALFNVKLATTDINLDDRDASVAWLTSNPQRVSGLVSFTGNTINDLIEAVKTEYDSKITYAEFVDYVNSVDLTNVSEANVTTTNEKFTALSEEFQADARADAELWAKVTTIMVSQFVQYVNGVDLNNVTPANVTESTEKLNATVDEFKTLLTTSDDYKGVYNKYLQIQIADFRAYVEGVDLDNITEENISTATAKYNALTDEFKAAVQADAALYSKYIAIVSGEFKKYINSLDVDNVTPAQRTEAHNKFDALSDEAKDAAAADAELWEKYTKTQTPDVDTNKHDEEAAKKADSATLPTTSDAIKDIGLEKSVDNVEDFVIDDLLPLLTDKIKITDKKDVVNSALTPYLTNATVGKVYALYAKLSHNQTDMGGGVTVGTLVQTQLIPTGSIIVRLYEDEFAAAKGKIYNVVSTNAVPKDDNGDPVQIEIGTDADGNPVYEDANIYDGIAAIEFADGDFGFTDGDREGFIKALLAVLRPITGICAPGSPLGIEFFNHADKKTGDYTLGIYECAAAVLEALGVTGLPTDAEYKAKYYTVLQTTYATATGTEDEKQLKAASIAGDEYLRPVIEGVFRLVDGELKTIPDILALIPRLGDLINSDTPRKIYNNLHADLGQLAGLIEEIEFQGSKVPTALVMDKAVLPSALLYLINDKLSDLGITLDMPNWEELNKYTTFKVNKSAQVDKDYVAVRYINGDVMFTELVYYAYDNLIADDENAAAVKAKLEGLPLIGKNVAPLIDNAKTAGKLKTYGAILDYFYESEDEKNYDATADAGKSIGEALAGINAKLNFGSIDCTNAVVKLSKAKFSYNGKIQKPSVTVTLDGEKLTKGIAYKVSYSNSKSKKVGFYKVKVTFIGGYEAPVKTLTYTIGPRNARKLKASAKKGAIKVKWARSKSKSAKGYVIQYSTSKSFKGASSVTVKGRKKTAKTIKGLQSGKKYYVRIRAYAVKSGKKIYSPYSGKKAVTVK